MAKKSRRRKKEAPKPVTPALMRGAVTGKIHRLLEESGSLMGLKTRLERVSPARVRVTITTLDDVAHRLVIVVQQEA